jgi:hypothetical protein
MIKPELRAAAVFAAAVLWCRPAPAFAASFDDLQAAGGWVTCSTSGSNCGGPGGKGQPVESTFDVLEFDGRPQAARIAVGGDVRYGTVYWYKKPIATANREVSTLELSVDFFIPAGSAYQAIEFDPQQVLNGKIFNFGWQANPKSRQWRIFDYPGSRWLDSGIAWDGLEAGVWHRFRTFSHTSGDAIVFDWIEIDGARKAVVRNQTQQAAFRSDYRSNELSLGLQLDQDSAGDPYEVYYDQVSVAVNSSGGSAPPTPAPAPAPSPFPPPAPAPSPEPAPDSDDDCSAPEIQEPTAMQPVGEAIHLRASGPSCLTAIKCYVDGNPKAAASARGDSLVQWVPVAMGAHVVSCNGWASGGKAYLSTPVPFVRTYTR